MKLSIVISLYNEKKYIQEIEQRVKRDDIPGIEKEIIIIDDFSNDGSRQIMKDELERLVDKIIYQE